MNQDQDQVFDGIKSAVNRWNATVSGALPDLKQDLRTIQASISELMTALELRYEITLPLLLARAQLDAVQQSDEDRQIHARKLVEQVNRLKEAFGNFEIETHTLAAQAQRARQASELLRESIQETSGPQHAGPELAPQPQHSAPDDTEQRRIAQLETELAAERERADALADRALTADVEEELQLLRSEVANFRRDQSMLSQAGTDLESDQVQRLREVATEESGKRRRMGQILVNAGIISEQQLEIALNEQRSSWSRHLGAILVQLGFATEETIAQTLAAQLRLPFVNVRYEDFPRETLEIVSQNLARLHTCIPLDSTKEDLSIVMANPLDIVALDDLRIATGRNIKVNVGAATEIKSAIERYYPNYAKA